MPRNLKLMRIEKRYDRTFDFHKDAPPVTWAEKALYDEVVQLQRQISDLQNVSVQDQDGETERLLSWARDVEELEVCLARCQQPVNPFDDVCGGPVLSKVKSGVSECIVCGHIAVIPSADEPEENNGIDPQAVAVEMAKSLELDAAVRIVAKGSSVHWNNLYLYAHPYGVDSAGVRISMAGDKRHNAELYFASDYGSNIKAFRYGPWVHRLLTEAKRIEAKVEVQAEIDRVLAEEQRRTSFEKVDF